MTTIRTILSLILMIAAVPVFASSGSSVWCSCLERDGVTRIYGPWGNYWNQFWNVQGTTAENNGKACGKGGAVYVFTGTPGDYQIVKINASIGKYRQCFDAAQVPNY